MKVLIFGDIFGKPGRRAVAAALPELRAKYAPLPSLTRRPHF
jgi:calcineurin-like phosphoesterase